MSFLDNVRVILVEPQHPGNVGAVARAMKNTGLWDLVVVKPACYDPESARWMAPNCSDLLARMRIVATLAEALEGAHRVVAATARHRRSDQPVLSPHDLAKQVATEDGVTAILFGREDHGLSNEDVHYASSVLRIPTPEHASLNLAQAVLVAGYTLFPEALRHGDVGGGRTLGGTGPATRTDRLDRRAQTDRADVASMEPAADAIVELLDRVGYFVGVPVARARLAARQGLQDARPSKKHVDAIRGMVKKVHWALDQGET